jgi:hypothetical protein
LTIGHLDPQRRSGGVAHPEVVRRDDVLTLQVHARVRALARADAPHGEGARLPAPPGGLAGTGGGEVQVVRE